MSVERLLTTQTGMYAAHGYRRVPAKPHKHQRVRYWRPRVSFPYGTFVV